VALGASDASAQGVNLSGRWQCVASCLGPQGSFAYITQNGWDLNVLNESGMPSRAWIDYPGHIWVEPTKARSFRPTDLRFNSIAERSGSAPRSFRPFWLPRSD
jgi:hypothetical protein